jgi:uncharacterized protein (DUF1330 family)
LHVRYAHGLHHRVAARSIAAADVPGAAHADIEARPRRRRIRRLAEFSTDEKDIEMPKAYWVSAYHAIHDPDKLAAYAKLAGPAIQQAGGRFLARGTAVKAYESGLLQRTVIVEFDSLADAIACHDGPAYQAAVDALDGGATRDLRIVEGA